MQNHGSRPTGSTPFPEANVTSHHDKGSNYRRGHGRGRGRGRNYGLVKVEVEVFLSRTQILTRSGERMVTNVTNRMGKWPMYVTVVEENVTGLVLVVHQSILLNFINNH